MDQLKAHPFENEVDKTLQTLEIDIATAKNIFDSGAMYRFIFNEALCYIGLPTYLPTSERNVMRFEFIVGEFAAKDVRQILFAITLDLDKERNCAMRVVPRTKNEKNYQIILQAVVEAEQIQPGFAASTILIGIELAEFYRNELLGDCKAV